MLSPKQIRRQNLKLRFLLVRGLTAILDMLTIEGGFLLAYVVNDRFINAYLSFGKLDFGIYLRLTLICTTGAVFIFLWQGVYRPFINQLRLEYNRRLLRSLLLAGAFCFIPFFYYQHLGDARGALTISILIIPLLLLFQKSFTGAILSRHFDRPERRIRLLILGGKRDASILMRKALSNWDPGYKIVGFLDREGEPYSQKITTESRAIQGQAPVLGNYDQLETCLVSEKVEELWVNDPMVNREELLEILKLCNKFQVLISIIPSIGRMPSLIIDAVKVGGQVLLREKQIPPRPIYDSMKRVFDLVVSSIVLLLLSPIIGLIALSIRKDSPGPAIFRQQRAGKNGKAFTLYKFRTMYSDADPYETSPANQHDQRITRVGRFLRRTSLDEIPQFWNVLRGDMSLVGPRPEMPFIVEKYNRLQRYRLGIKPGITGLWQISGDRSIPIHQNLDYDLYYIENRSLITDMVILWRTLWTALNGI